MKNHQDFYTNNSNYSNFLNSHNPKDYFKYVKKVHFYCNEGKFLDVGCGVGTSIDILNKFSSSNLKSVGIEISKTSVKMCGKKQVNALFYDGNKIPFKDEYFDVVGSFNVLEHTSNPIKFLNEKYRVLKKGGILIIVCPNFLSVTNNYHYHTSGIINKVRNIILLIFIYLSKLKIFFKMDTVISKIIKPDHDAVNVTNSITILNWGKSKNMNLLYWSSQQLDKLNSIQSIFDKGIFRVFFGSVFLILKK